MKGLDHMPLNTPLADRIRPQNLDDIVGQKHLVGKYGVLRKVLNRGSIPSMIFYGPPGCGKTTVASIIAKMSEYSMYKLNATTANIKDIHNIVSESGTITGSNGILLYLDEIQYFNKKQQQSLLEYLEDGRITLIASTTENPYYYIYDALISRCMVFEFKHVSSDEIFAFLKKTVDREFKDLIITDRSLNIIANAASGDVRKAVGILEMASLCCDDEGVISDQSVIDMIPSVSQSNFDRDGDVHYNLLSCLQKSIRGSDPDAAVFYLARLLEGGDLISPCRRLMVIASEDIGMAYPMAPVIVRACIESARELGLPEARIPLAHAAVMLATAPKSNSAYMAYAKAEKDIHEGKGIEIPKHLQSPGFFGYKYPHDYENNWVEQQYLPNDIKNEKYYIAGNNKFEKSSEEYFNKIKNKSK